MNRPHNIPPPAPNGGLYTGTPFAGPWGNVPVIPDVDYMTHINLRSANPPKEALMQYPGTVRLGNNHQTMPGVQWAQPLNDNMNNMSSGRQCQVAPASKSATWSPSSPWSAYQYL